MNPGHVLGNANVASIHGVGGSVGLLASSMCGAKAGCPTPNSARHIGDPPEPTGRATRLVNSPVIFRLVAGNLHERGQSPLFRMNS
jgi:hypothetical protein